MRVRFFYCVRNRQVFFIENPPKFNCCGQEYGVKFTLLSLGRFYKFLYHL